MSTEHESKADVAHVEAQHPDEVTAWVGLSEDARNATSQEHQLTLRQALKLYPKACLWVFIVCLVVIMDGYDTSLMGNLQGYPAFQKRFGVPLGKGKYTLEAKWQTALGLASPVGNIVGIYLNAIITERWGHKKSALGTMVFIAGVLFIPFFSHNVQVLFVGQLLCGFAWGVFTTLAPAYASEVTPVILRSYLETYVVLCWGIGQFIATGILDGLNHNGGDWAWRIPFAVQWVWPVIITPFLFFAPESPWWLVRKGRIQDAEKSVLRLSNLSPAQAKESVALMVETTNIERSITEGSSILDCFRGSNGWRTEIGCVAWSSQVFVGFAISSLATYFYEQAGLPTADAYKMAVGQSAIHFVCTLCSVFLTGKYGRRPLMIGGYIGMAGCMYILGFMACVPNQTSGLGYGQSVMYLLWYCAYELTLGPLAFIIVSEISSTRLRSHSIALGRNAYNVANIFSTTVAPYTLNPNEGHWKGKTAFLAAGFGTACLVWAWFRLPESKDRTYEELDILFNRKGLNARNFSEAVVEEAEIQEYLAQGKE